MSEEKNVSAGAGSTNGSANGTNAGKPGEVSNNEENVPKAKYDELFTKLGEQGEELGSLRKLFEDTSPLLEKLNASPDLIKAIMDDKLSDENLIKAVAEGKVSIADATKVEKASEAVKAEVGAKELEKMSPEKLSKLIEEKMSGVTKEFKEKISSMEEDKLLEKYENKTNEFISSHKDFPEHAVEIHNYMEEHNILDVEIGYDAVVGKKLQEKMAADSENNAKEEAKNIASNMGGGHSMRGRVISDKKLVDELIAS
jgi:cupin superfamily acireductone dioxygenase involved in methionine salvage